MKVSIIIPVYNSEKYIEECLDSVCAQTHRELEILCVNDGSTDSSVDIIRRYMARDDRVRLISKPNGGVASARNRGLDEATGDYVFCVDSDDTITRGAIEHLLRHAEEYDADIVIAKMPRRREALSDADSGACVVESKLLKKIMLDYYRYNPELPEGFRLKNHWVLNFSTGRLYRRAVVANVRYPEDMPVGEDYPFSYNALDNAARVVLLNENLYYYRVVEGSMTGVKLQPWMAENILKNAELIRRTTEGDPELREAGYQYIMRSVVECYTSYFRRLKRYRDGEREIFSQPYVVRAVRAGRFSHFSRKYFLRAKLMAYLHPAK